MSNTCWKLSRYHIDSGVSIFEGVFYRTSSFGSKGYKDCCLEHYVYCNTSNVYTSQQITIYNLPDEFYNIKHYVEKSQYDLACNSLRQYRKRVSDKEFYNNIIWLPISNMYTAKFIKKIMDNIDYSKFDSKEKAECFRFRVENHYNFLKEKGFD